MERTLNDEKRLTGILAVDEDFPNNGEVKIAKRMLKSLGIDYRIQTNWSEIGDVCFIPDGIPMMYSRVAEIGFYVPSLCPKEDRENFLSDQARGLFNP